MRKTSYRVNRTALVILALVPLVAALRATELAGLVEVNVAGPRMADVLIGPAQVTDGDSIVVGGVRVRLEGIDAPETKQMCSTADGRPWPCGLTAARTLRSMIGNNEVRCDKRGHDKYGRVLAVCSVGDTVLNEAMVRRGLAWAFVRYSRAYSRVEGIARSERIGIWQGEARPPWEHRATAAQPSRPQQITELAATESCIIKGNVTASGLVYHLPTSALGIIRSR